MPVVDVRISDIERLLGKSVDVEELRTLVESLKCEVERLDDDILEYEATHDRPDLFSAEGLARALQGLMEIEIGLRRFRFKDYTVEVQVGNVYYRPYIACAIVKNLRLDDEGVRQIMQLQEKLHMTYCRNRRRASIGVYDLDTIKPPIKYLLVPKDEIKFVPLECAESMRGDEILKRHPKGIEYGHIIAEYDEYPLLIDSEGTVLSMPPIINSEDTKVTPKTKNMFIDVTGTDLRTVMQMLTIMVCNIAERGAPEVIEGTIVVAPTWSYRCPDLKTETLKLNVDYVNDIIGLSLKQDDVAKYLMMMRHDVEKEFEGTLRVSIAPYRIDILHEIDLVEDVAMAYGYDKLEPELPIWHYTIGKEDPIERFTRLMRETLVGIGFTEVANYMLTNVDIIARRMRIEGMKLVELENPISERFTVVRTWIIPQLLEMASLNKVMGYPLKLFEAGDVVIPDESLENRARSERHLAAIIASPDITVVDALVVLNAVARGLGLRFTYRNAEHPSFIEGRFGLIMCRNEQVGIVGEVHPEVLENFELDVPVAAFELNLNRLHGHYLRRVEELL